MRKPTTRSQPQPSRPQILQKTLPTTSHLSLLLSFSSTSYQTLPRENFLSTMARWEGVLFRGSHRLLVGDHCNARQRRILNLEFSLPRFSLQSQRPNNRRLWPNGLPFSHQQGGNVALFIVSNKLFSSFLNFLVDFDLDALWLRRLEMR